MTNTQSHLLQENEIPFQPNSDVILYKYKSYATKKRQYFQDYVKRSSK